MSVDRCDVGKDKKQAPRVGLAMWRWCVALAVALSAVDTASLTSRTSGGAGEPPPPECAWRRAPADGEELACALRTASGAAELLASLDSSRAQRVTSLELRCTDVLFFESSLDVGRRGAVGLQHYRALRRLRLDSCKLRYVPAAALAGLPSLRELVLRTHNDDWSAMSLELHRDALRGLSELRALDLADNNIWALPAEVFCPARALQQLNATRNRLQDISALGFSDWGEGPSAPGKSCNSALETLDLSHNEVRELRDNALSGLRALRRLLLQHNRIESVADRAFVGLADLQLLNLSSNSLRALPPETFQSSRDIRQVYLHNNSLSVLAPGLLEGLDQLQILDLSANQLTSEWVNRDTFSGLVRLVVLDLSDNRITKVDGQLFQDLNNLQFLSLERNRVSRLAEGAFANLKNLHSLSLANNEIVQIDINHFSNLYVLNQLFLDGNKINKMDPRCFENITKLHDLGISGNSLTEVPEAIKTLRFLTSLDLGTNKITKVTSSQFEGLDDLYGLQLVGNRIEKISKDTFAPLSSLQVLNLAANNLDRIDSGAFASSAQLRALGLDGNRLTDLEGIFSPAQAIAWLNVSSNRLMRFDYAHVPPALQWLDLSRNSLERLQDERGARAALALKVLDASYNKLRALDEHTLPDVLETALLDHNEISVVQPGAFLGKPALAKVVLYANRLRGLAPAALASVAPMPGEVYLGANPFACDCHLEWLGRPPPPREPRLRVADLDQLACTPLGPVAPVARAAPVPLVAARPTEFLCRYDSHCSPLCHCCDFDACDCEMTCPEKCSCYRDNTWNTNIVDCSRAGYEDVPERIPMDATEIYLDGNNIREMGNLVFLGKKRLQVLHLNNSNVSIINDKSFYGLESLRVLRLDNNNLREVRRVQLSHLPSLVDFDLSDNNISDIEHGAFEDLTSLRSVRLDRNGEAHYEPWQVGAAARVALSTTAVRWRCDCAVAARLERWLADHDVDPAHSVCHTNNSVASAAARCRQAREPRPAAPESRSRAGVAPASGQADAVPLVAAALACAALLLLLGALLALFREELELWLHARHGVRLRVRRADPAKTLDALVLYSPHDAEFVARALAGELEARGSTLCLQHRDLPPGERRAPAALATVARRARRVLVVVSAAFLQAEWAAGAGAAAAAGGALVCVVTTDLSAARVQPELRALLKAGAVVVWGERRCRRRLALLLPEPGGRAKPASPGAPALRYTAPPGGPGWARGADDSCSLSSECPHYARIPPAAPAPRAPRPCRPPPPPCRTAVS